MTKFYLRTEQVLQGDFTLGDLNLILVFQVNCPGCFIYALPLAAKLHDQYRDRIKVLCLSTAFEDFEINTAENTQRLLESGEIVGVTKQYFQQQKIEKFSTPLEFPVAFDRETFALNALPGTPTWIFCDRDYRVLVSWFGHKPELEVDQILKNALWHAADR